MHASQYFLGITGLREPVDIQGQYAMSQQRTGAEVVVCLPMGLFYDRLWFSLFQRMDYDNSLMIYVFISSILHFSAYAGR